MDKVLSVNINDVLIVINDWVDVRITKEMVKEVLDEDEGLFSEIARFGIYDTVSREMAADALAQKFTGMDWPINGDSQATKDEFDKRWQKAMFEATGCNYNENKGKCNKGTYFCSLEHEDV